MTKDYHDVTVEHINNNLKAFKTRWANMKAAAKKKAEQEQSMTDEEKRKSTEEAKRNEEEERKRLEEMRGQYSVAYPRAWVKSRPWNQRTGRLTPLDELYVCLPSNAPSNFSLLTILLA